MRLNGAQIAVKALENLGISYTFGIPGTHTTELYDALAKSETIRPVLVAHEGGGAFMADAVSRTTNSVGCLTIVPAAGLTHALSGIGEAFLAGIPMLVLAGGIRRDTGMHYQLHHIDMKPIAQGITKAQFLIENHAQIVPVLYEAYQIAITGEPGPVFVEIPAEILMFSAEIDAVPAYIPDIRKSAAVPAEADIEKAAKLLSEAKNPMLFLGWGALGAQEYSIKIAEKLKAPVALTLQGKSAFPNTHPLYAGCFLGRSAVPAGREAYERHDVLLAAGCRFSEIATGSYGIEAPRNLIHTDINSEVFNKNYPAAIAIEGDAEAVLKAIWERIKDREIRNNNQDSAQRLSALHKEYRAAWSSQKQDKKVTPGRFFEVLNQLQDEQTITVLDDGHHTYLAAELLDVVSPGSLLTPTDFNCMGYCIPAAIGAKLANPDKTVFGIAGDGAAQMTGLELVTAASLGLAPVIFVFNDGELSQIAQFQKTPLNKKTGTKLGGMNFEGLAAATGAEYIHIKNNAELDQKITAAVKLSYKNKPVLVDVNIDYTKKTAFTKGVIKTNLSRFPLREKIRFILRALKRHTIG